MAGDLRGVYLIGNKTDKLVTAVLVLNLTSGELSTLPLQEYVHRGIEPADGTLPWEQDITPKPAAPQPGAGEIRLEGPPPDAVLSGAGGMIANSDVVPGEKSRAVAEGRGCLVPR
jgi:hypothetical protein